jgi:4-amino-4-deoxy-L-arabinose transferase-like glycosyltransferase
MHVIYPHQRKQFIGLALLLLIGFSLRMLRLDDLPLSGDEAYSVVVWVRTSLPELLHSIALALTEPHPPLALIAFHSWARMVGESLLALRAFSVLASMITLASLYRIARELSARNTAIVAVTLGIVSPFQLWYGQFARNYSLWMALSALSILFLIRGWKHPQKIIGWIPYILCAVATGYVFYLEVFLYIAHNIYALFKMLRQRSALPYWASTQAIIAGALAPWYLNSQIFINSRTYEPNAGPANLQWAIQNFIIGETLPRPWQPANIADPTLVGAASVLALLLLAGSLGLLIRRSRRDAAWLLIPAALLPMLMLGGLALVTGRGYFHPRYIASSNVPMILLVSVGIGTLLQNKRESKWAAMSLIAGIMTLNLLSVSHYLSDPRFAKGPPWTEIMETLSDQSKPDELIIFNFPDPAFTYYMDQSYSGGAPGIVLPDSANPSVEAVAPTLEAITADREGVWFMPVGGPNWDADQVIAGWLAETMQETSRQQIGVMSLIGYAPWEIPHDQPMTPLTLVFSGVVRLAGYGITPGLADWEPGQTVYLQFYWSPLATTDKSLKSFVHLLGPSRGDDSILWAQDDHFPQQGRIDSQYWQAETRYRDVYILTLPTNLSSGDYQLVTGWYDPETNARLLTDTGSDTGEVLVFSVP